MSSNHRTVGTKMPSSTNIDHLQRAPKKRRTDHVIVLPEDGNGVAVDNGDYLAVAELLFRSNEWFRLATKPRISELVETQEKDGGHRITKLHLGGYFSVLAKSLSSLPHGIGRLKNLQELSLDHTENLLELPNEIGDLTSLIKLNLDYSTIKSLPSSIGCLKNLEVLSLFGTKNLSELPNEIGVLTGLKKLDLHVSNIKLLPASIGQLKNLEELSLYRTENLLELPNEIGDLTGLKKLDLSWSKIKSLPSSIVQLKNLQELTLWGTNNFSELPNEVWNLTGLIKLDLSASNIKLLPASIGQLKNLQELSLYRTENLLELPNEIGNLTSLIKLNLCHSTIKSLPASTGQLKNLEKLSLSHTTNLLGLPNEIHNLTSLKKLDLRGSNIKSLPSSIGHLKNLEELELSLTTDLLELPNEIGDLTNLIRLDLSGSKIESLPSSIGHLKNLQHLLLKDTKSMLTLPDEIGKLSSLKCLSLSCSSIQLLPDSIVHLANLIALDVSDSGITSFPCSIQKLKGLKHLGLGGIESSVHHLLTIIGHCKSLGFLDLDEHSLEKRDQTKIGCALASNRSECRMRSLMADTDIAPMMPKVWPLVMSTAKISFDAYSAFFIIYNDFAPFHHDGLDFNHVTLPHKISKLDAMHQVLVSGRESLIQILVDLKGRPPVKRKVCFTHSNIHDTILKLVPNVKEFNPSVIIANGWEGSPLVQMLQAEVKIPVLTVSLEVSADQPMVRKRQWFDKNSEDGRKAFHEKVLIVDLVDDTRAMLRYCVEELLQTNVPTNVAVAVVHNKRKAKIGGKFPEGVLYMAGAMVEDHWDCCYPWEASSRGNTLREHETLASRCHLDW